MPKTIERPPSMAPEKQLEVLGRVLLAVQQDHDLRDVMPSLDYWAALGGGYVLEWWEGLYATELHEKLLEGLTESGSSLLLPVDFTERTDIDSDDRERRLFLLIRGVPVEFRSCRPLGYAVADARRCESIRRITAPDSTAANSTAPDS